MTATTRFAAALLAVLLSCLPACTAVKPVTCAIVHPVNQFGRALKTPRDDEDDYNDLPTVPTLVVAPVLIPFNYVVHTVRGAVGGLASGFVSDLNVITGNATTKTTMDTLTLPFKTNAPKPKG